MKMRPFQTIAQIIIATSLVNCAPAAVRPGRSGLGQSVAGRSGVSRGVKPFLDRKPTAPEQGSGEPFAWRDKVVSFTKTPDTPRPSDKTPEAPAPDKTPDTLTPKYPPKAPTLEAPTLEAPTLEAPTPKDHKPETLEAPAPPNPEMLLKDLKGQSSSLSFDSATLTGLGLISAAGIIPPVVYYATKHKQNSTNSTSCPPSTTTSPPPSNTTSCPPSNTTSPSSSSTSSLPSDSTVSRSIRSSGNDAISRRLAKLADEERRFLSLISRRAIESLD